MQFFNEHPKILGVCGLWASGFIFAYHGFTDATMTQWQALSWILTTLIGIVMVVSCSPIPSQIQIDKVEIIAKSMSIDGDKERNTDDAQAQQEE